MNDKLIAVVGPTAAGKTRLAVQLADRFNGEIISADSRQVYRGMDIGTGKDLDEFRTGEKSIPYHLIDVADPSEEFNLFRYKKLFIEAYLDISRRGRQPILAGGTGMYISSIVQNYKLTEGDFSKERYEELNSLDTGTLKEKLLSLKRPHNRTDLVSRERLIRAIMANSGNEELGFQFNTCIIGVSFDREELKQRITSRLKQRLESGMIEEVRRLLDQGISYEKMLFFGLEYKYIALYLKGELTYNDMFRELGSAIKNFAKRQMTWYRKMEREGVVINWVSRGDFKSAEEMAGEFLKK